jgi:hypothetical protein
VYSGFKDDYHLFLHQGYSLAAISSPYFQANGGASSPHQLAEGVKVNNTVALVAATYEAYSPTVLFTLIEK